MSSQQAWRDSSLSVDERATALLGEMTLREKVAQLYGVWVGASPDGGDVAPHQHSMSDEINLDELLVHGLGQLTRPFGSAPIDPAVGLVSLARAQRRIMAAGRFGIPALAHEECLSGFTAWGAAAFPVPLSWGASFNPALIRAMARRIGGSMRSVGIHQGLAPVLDVTRDARWGRTEETIGEDPYLVGTIASAYIQGLESTGIIATLKHFVGYSASRAGRNLAPVSIGPRELADVMLPPFEMAVRESGVRSVMHSYADIDGVPPAADETLLTGLLRTTWGFEGTVVADYFGIAFLKTLHAVAGSWGEAGATALRAGVDVELPTVKSYGTALIEEIEQGRLDEAFVDRALLRVLRQKAQLGLLDADWSPFPDGWREDELEDIEALRGSIDLDDPADRSVARELAEQAVILLANDGTLPLNESARIAVIGPRANDPLAMLGCYSFPSHVGALHPDVPLGIVIPTVLEALSAEFASAQVAFAKGCGVDDDDRTEFASALALARESDVVIVCLGDRAGLFGRGTSGEGCDAESLTLPGVQQELLDALLDSGTPVVLSLITGRPYALGAARTRAAAIVQSFFPGEEGAGAIAGVISGRINPSGRLPVSIPAQPHGQPATYLAAPLARANAVSNVDPTAAFGFGHGIGYATFEWSDLIVDGAVARNDDSGPRFTAIDGSMSVGLSVTNSSDRDGVEVVQLYLHDPVASVVLPVNRLIGFARVSLDAKTSARVDFEVPSDLTSFTGMDMSRIIEPGDVQLRLAASSEDVRLTAHFRLVGERRRVDHTRALHCTVTIVHSNDGASK